MRPLILLPLDPNGVDTRTDYGYDSYYSISYTTPWGTSWQGESVHTQNAVEQYYSPSITITADAWETSATSWQGFSGEGWSFNVFQGQFDSGSNYMSVANFVSSQEHHEYHDTVRSLSFTFGDWSGYLEHDEHSELNTYAYKSPEYLSRTESWMTSVTDIIHFQGPGFESSLVHTDQWSGTNSSSQSLTDFGAFASLFSSVSHDTIDTSHIAMLGLTVDAEHAVHSDVMDIWSENPWGSYQSHVENYSDSQTTHVVTPEFDMTEVLIVGSYYQHDVNYGMLDYGGKG